MTSNQTRAEAVRALIEKVEAGADISAIYDALRNFPVQYTASVVDAYHGSLDAAKALHEALVPEAGWEVNGRSARVENADGHAFYGQSRNQLCACRWLIAILRAHLATLEADHD